MAAATVTALGLCLAFLGALPGPAAKAPASPQPCCPVLELRQYTLLPGQRDVLIELFDREFVESQEADGMRIVGQFRDLDAPDHFVWVRGFPDMPERARALDAFYTGPVWKANSKAANATMVDVSNVLLLRPARPGSGFALEGLRRPAPGAAEAPKSLVIATIFYFAAPPDEGYVDFFDREVAPLWKDAGASILGTFVTESAANTFPALPVREGEHAVVVFSVFRDGEAYAQHLATLGRSEPWKGPAEKALLARLAKPPETLRLRPTARSLLGQ